MPDQTVPETTETTTATATTPDDAGKDKAKAPAKPDPRLDRMAEIERQNNERIAKELGVNIEDLMGTVDTPDEDADLDDIAAEAERKRLEREAEAVERQAQLDKQLTEPEPTKAKAQEKKPAGTPSSPTVIENFEDVMVKTKVDGKEVMRPLSELVRIEQKEAAAAQRLEQATRMREEAQRFLDEAKSKTTQPTESKEQQPKTPAATPDDAAAKEFLSALYAGEEDKALAAVNKLFEKGRGVEAPATPDSTAIAKSVKQQIDTELALETFGNHYQDIVSDPYLAEVADRFLHAELTVGTALPEALAKAGKATRDWVKQKAGSLTPPTTTTTPQRDEKLARKQEIDVIPSINASAATPEPKPPTPSDTIAEMRKARNLA